MTDEIMLYGWTFGVVAELRARWPSLDGRIVWIVALCVGIAVSVLATGSLPRAWPEWQTVLIRGLRAGGAAVVGARGASYLVGKVGSATA